MPDSIGNTLNDARSIIIGTTTKRFSDSVEFGDQDYFRFTLASASSFSLSLTGLGANADVELLDSIGNSVTVDSVLLRSSNEGTLPDAINTILNPGTYYIRVTPGAPADPNNPSGTTPTTNYNLDVRADNGIRSDIIWRYYAPNTGFTAIWQLEGTNFQTEVSVFTQPDTAWVVAGSGDFNGDGISDLLWRYYGNNPASIGQNSIWLLDSNGSATSFFLINPEPDTNWIIRGVGNFDNGFGKPDIFWQNSATGQIRAWFLDDAYNVTAAPVLGIEAVDFNAIQAVGDFNQDGNTDLVGRQAEVYEISFSTGGFNFAPPQQIVPEPNLNKLIQGSGDFNGDGFSDLLWRDYSTGANEVWLLEGTSLASVAPIFPVGDGLWQAISPYTRRTPVSRPDLAGTPNNFIIGLLNGSGVYRDEITAADPDDYYQFTLGSRTRLDLALNGLGTNALQANLDVQIISSTGTIVAQSTNGGSVPESLTNLNLNQGTYFIRVLAGEAGAASLYDLELTVNNLPVLVSSGPITVNEGFSQTISSNALLVTDDNDLPPRVIYTLVAPPTLGNGSLLSNGQALLANSTFSQADINSGRLVYQNNGNETTQDSFVFAVSDGRGGTIPNTTLTIVVTPANDPPVLRSLNPLAVTEGLVATISSNTLLVTDVEQSAAQIVYTLSSLPTAGSLSRLEGSLIGPITLGSTFTQADINANRIGFSQNGAETTTDSFTFVATDGAGGFLNPQTQTLAINVTPVNDPPVLLTNVPLTVSQAGPGFITSTLLRATDAELLTPAQQDQIRYTVTNLPTSGTLFFNSVAQSSPFVFSQADLNAGNALAYAQGGNPNNSDRFTFRISDGTATVPTTGDFTYEIFIQRVAGPPVLATLNPRITLDEGATAPIDTATLQVTDPDSAAFLITYTLGATPASGSLLRLGTALTTGQTFTQQDIDSNRIQYQHNGNEQPLTDSFTFTFKDEAGAGPTGTQTLSITINSVNDAPTLLTTNPQLTVTEGFAIGISQTLLNATDPDNLAQGITYSVVDSPTGGTIQRSGTQVSSFTQADINAGQIQYLQNGSESTSDSFSFNIVDSLGASGGTGTVNISVIPFNDAPGIAVRNPLTVNEGETATIDGTFLEITDIDGPGPITYTIGSLPSNGVLRRGNVTLSTGGTFTQADVSNGQLFYINNGSETATGDRFTFTASDGATTGAGAPGLVPLTTFTITVTPTNDSPGISLNTGLTLSEGGLSTISSNALRATDPDNIASQLTYSVLSGPSSGTLLSAGVAITSFTQAQLNGNAISYRQNGSEVTLDEFIFEVADGVGGASGTQTFNISITSVNDAPTLVANTGIPVDEGGTATLSDAVLLAADPDGPSESVIFTLGAAPGRGSLLRNGLTLTNGQTFTQADISGSLVSYIDSGRDPVTNDRFTFTASDGSTGVLPLRTFSITVSPINDAPVITAPTVAVAAEDTTFTFTGTNGLVVADIDGGPSYNVQLAVLSGGTLNLGSTSGLTGLSGNNSSAISFTAPLGNVNSAIRNLRYRGTQDFNGAELLVISINDGNSGGLVEQTVTINVTPVNDGPTLTASTASLSLLEDQTPAPTFNFTVNDVDAGDSPLSVVLRATNGGISVSDTGTLSFDPAGANGSSVVIFTGTLLDVQTALSSVAYQSNPNYFGSDRITVSVNDQGANGAPGPTPSVVSRTINVNVTSVNDQPTFTVTGNSVINVNEDAPQQVVPFASSIFSGAINETQGLSFSIAPSSPADAALLPNLFTATPTINSTSGNLTFTPRANANGTVTLQAFLVDNGGTANGGQNTSAPFQFVLEVNQVNDRPSFNRGTVPNVTEDSGAITINNWATNISVGPTSVAANESTQVPSFIFETSNPSLFVAGPEVVNLAGNTAALTFTPAPDANGVATVTVRLQDDGGTANGGADTTAPQTFTINVLSRNDAPTFTQLATDVGVLEDDVQQSVQIADSIVVGPFNELTQTATFTISSNSNPNLFLASSGGIAPLINPQGFLTFKTATNAFGSAVIVGRLVDNGGTANGGANQSAPFTFTINATGVNDAPSFTRGANQTVNEDAAAQSIANWATNISPGPNEVGQVVTFGVENNNNALFSAQPTIDATGRLTYTPAANAFGTAIVTVSLVDNGGTDNGGVDTSAPQSFTITVNPVNDAPTFINLPGSQTTQEDQAITFSGLTGIQFTDIDSGNNPIEVRLTVRNGTVLLPSTNGLSVSSGSNGSSTVTFTGTIADFTSAFASLVYTPNPTFNGTDGLTVVVNDRGNFGSGGTRSITGSIPITITSVNNPPELLTLGQLTVEEGGNGTISNTLLRTTDVDNTATQIIYTLLDAPDTGALRLSVGAGSFTTIAVNGTFTQNDINTGRLNYIQNGSETETDSFLFRVSDGQIPLPDATFNIRVIPVDDAPAQAVNLGASVNEGELVTIDGSRLQYTDNDDPSNAIVYTITSAPTGGTLRLGGSDLTLGSTFTQEQLDIGLLTYEQSGSESTSDNFNFQVSDGTTTLQGVFNIAVTAVNDPPRFISQGALTVNEGASAPVSSAVLTTTDPDTPTNQLIYTVTGGPGFGTLLRNNSTTILVGQTFTQAEVNSGAITYRNNGSEVSSDAFFFNVTDGTGTDAGILNINVGAVNDAPVVVRNNGLTLSAATPTTRVLNNSQLFASDVDNPDPTQVRFRVTTLPDPAIGELVVGGTRLTQGQFFTQDDVNRSRVSYRYLGNGTSDGFQYTVEDIAGATGGSRFFRITFTA
ncbi:MAG: cadherin-like domain-containing protein [Leptolyngbyaceae cyanobacterium bins.302]|nr:cadherin-like domain-containing protein [Leptolyngbyaceae cyanobacterium bins.302]